MAVPPTTTDDNGILPTNAESTMKGPLYSQLLKTRVALLQTTSTSPSSQYNPPETMNDSQQVKIIPQFESYEPDPLDTSLVIANGSTIEYTSSEEGTAAPDSPPPVPTYNPGEQEMVIYEDVDSPEATPVVNDNLRKNLADMHATSSNVCQYQSLTFPERSLANMKTIHYAAADGNKKSLAEIILQLPRTVIAPERLMEREWMCTRQGIDERDSEGRTALMHAVQNHHTQCVKILVESGANVNAVANDGSSAVHQCAYSGRAEMLALLLSLGGNGTLKDNDKRNPLHWCTNTTDPESIKTLLDKVPNLDVDTRDAALMTPLMWAAFHGKLENIRILKDYGADQSLFDVDGMTALHWSVHGNNIQALKALINLESSQYSDHKGKTVMHQAAEKGCAKAVSLIQAVRPTSMNDRDNNGRTPLHWATVCENTEVIRALLASGATPLVTDYNDYTPLNYATEKKLHYCGLLLAHAEQSLKNTSFCSYLAHSTPPEADKASVLQEGQLQPLEDVLLPVTSGQLSHTQSVFAGAWINKFTNDGKGPLHPRLFWVEPASRNVMICWTKTNNKLSKETRKEFLVGVRSSASPAVTGRKDFDPLHQHKYSFTIVTAARVLDVVAVSSEDYKIWLSGLQLLLDGAK